LGERQKKERRRTQEKRGPGKKFPDSGRGPREGKLRFIRPGYRSGKPGEERGKASWGDLERSSMV